MSSYVNRLVLFKRGVKRIEERDQSEKLQTTMVSAKKSAPEKKRKKTIKVNNGEKKRKDDNKNKTSNGGVVPVTHSSSSSDSRNDVETGVEITQKPTGGKNSKQKAKRQFAEKEDANLNKFPMERVRRIIRSEDSDMRITNEAVFLVNKATEKFLEKFCDEAYICSVQDRKKSLAYKHLSSVVSKRKRYDFLSDFVPEKVKAEDALAERKLMGPETA